MKVRSRRERIEAVSIRDQQLARGKVAAMQRANAERELAADSASRRKLETNMANNSRIDEQTRNRATLTVSRRIEQAEVDRESRVLQAKQIVASASAKRLEEGGVDVFEREPDRFQAADIGSVGSPELTQGYDLGPLVEEPIRMNLSRTWAESDQANGRVINVLSAKPADEAPRTREYGKPLENAQTFFKAVPSVVEKNSDQYSISEASRAALSMGQNPLKPGSPNRLPGSAVTLAEAEALATEAELIFRLPAGTLVKALYQEAPRVLDKKRRHVGFDPASKGGASGKFLGLYQFDFRSLLNKGNYAWEMARSTAKRFGVDIGSAANWADPRLNTMAAGAYAAMHKAMIEAAGYVANADLLYYAHQQGTGSLQAALNTGDFKVYGKQSKSSTKLFDGLVAAK